MRFIRMTFERIWNLGKKQIEKSAHDFEKIGFLLENRFLI